MAEQERAELLQVLERREAALREWRSLSSRSKRDEEAALERVKELNRLADDVAEQEARAREEEQRRRVVEAEASLAQAEASVRELGERLAGERKRLRVLERETLRARQHDPAAKAGVETLEVREREQVEWFAQHRPHRSKEWPVELRDQVAARRGPSAGHDREAGEAQHGGRAEDHAAPTPLQLRCPPPRCGCAGRRGQSHDGARERGDHSVDLLARRDDGERTRAAMRQAFARGTSQVTAIQA